MKRRTTARLKSGIALAAIVAQLGVCAGPASAFCGFYVAKADAKMFNKSSKVVIARNGQHTAITMASDYEGEPNEFALVVPVPTFIAKDQISVVETGTIDHLDAYTAPRLVRYDDPNPCPSHEVVLAFASKLAPEAAPAAPVYRGVKLEAQYDVAEYDVAILSAEESDGLARWLTDNGYRLPAGAAPVLASYIKQNMRFFVAKVNLKRMQKIGKTYLRPLQVRYDTAKFMLPLRLGTVNANGPQDLIVYALTPHGRVEAANYRTVKVPSGIEVPHFVQDDFAGFYKAAFERAVARETMRSVFVEYAWDMSSCDPCASMPMSRDELAELGVRQMEGDADFANRWQSQPGGLPFVTRLHVRYDAASFPEDLNFTETRDREGFQGRYILQYPWTGPANCAAAADYRASLPLRSRQEAKNLADLTGWPQKDIEQRMATSGEPLPGGR
jgi:hypothetical protein